MLKRCLSFLVCVGLLRLMLGDICVATESNIPNPIRMGGSLESMHDGSATDAEIGIQLFFNEILSEGDISFSVKIYDDDEFLIQKFKQQKLHAIFINSLRFLELEELIHPSARYVVQYGPTVKRRYLVLVRNSDKVLSLADLRDRKLTFSTGHHVGKRFLDVKLLEQGLPESDFFFRKVKIVENANTAIVDLYFSKTDVALVPSHSFEVAVELNPQISRTVSVLTKSKPMVDLVVGMRQGFPQEQINRYEPYILTDIHTERIKHVLRTFNISRLHRVTDDTLKEVRELNERYLLLTDHQP
jgi:ABC-type phosphate/phosphonate transport system substrate-binding protein